MERNTPWCRLTTAFVMLTGGVFFCRDVVRSGRLLGRFESDWDQHLVYHAVPRQTVLQFGQLPLWNPWLACGHPMLGNPQSRFLTPWFLIHLAFGTVAAIKTEIVGHVVVGVALMYVLCRSLSLSRVGSMYAGFVFGTCGSYALHLNEGHTTFLSMMYVPAAFYCMIQMLERSTWLVGVSAVLALTVFEGGVYPFFASLLGLGVIAIATAVENRSTRPLYLFGGAVVLAGLFAAVRLLPILELLRTNPRSMPSEEVLPLTALYHVFLSPDQSVFSRHQTTFRGPVWGWHEYGFYIGFPAVILAGLGFRRVWREHRAFAVCGLALFVVALGRFAAWSPWALLHDYVPPFGSLHVPSRFLWITVLVLAIAAACGVDRCVTILSRWMSTRMAQRLAVFCVVLFAGHQSWISGRSFSGAFPREPERHQRGSSFGLIAGHPRMMYSAFLANRGTCVNCYEFTSLLPRGDHTASALHASDSRIGLWRTLGESEGTDTRFVAFRPAEHAESTEAKIAVARFSPNRLVIDVDSSGPGWLLIGQVNDGNWRSSTHHVTRSAGMIAVEVTAGQHRVELRYLPTSFLVGLAISVMTTVLVVGVLIRHRHLHSQVDPGTMARRLEVSTVDNDGAHSPRRNSKQRRVGM